MKRLLTFILLLISTSAMAQPIYREAPVWKSWKGASNEFQLFSLYDPQYVIPMGRTNAWTITELPTNSMFGFWNSNGTLYVSRNTNGTVTNYIADTGGSSPDTNTYATRAYVDAADLAMSNSVLATAAANDLASSNVLASRITTTSNGVTSAFGAADTVVSNALQTGIDGKTNRFPLASTGLSIASATTNSIVFDVFTADTNTLATRAWATAQDTVVSNGLNAAKMDIDGGNAAATVIFSGAFEASTITPQNTIDASVSGSEISFGATYYIKNLASAGITIGKGAQSYLALSDSTGTGPLFGGVAPRSSVAATATTHLVRWDEWSSSNTTLQSNINTKTNAVLLAGTNISLGDGTTNGVRFFTVNQQRPLPLAFVAGPVTNDVVAATNMSATFSFPFDVTLAYATVTTREAPATTGLILDVNTNGVSIFSNTNKLTVSTGTTGNTNSSFNSPTIPANARITVDVDQAPGSGSGRAPTAVLWYYPQ